jgi:hypothetical protein
VGLLHSAFLFDYAHFRQDIDDLLSEASKSNFLPVYERAKQNARHIEPEDWILHQHGTTLSLSPFEDKKYVEQDGLDESVEVGYCLLVILSSYLENCPSLGENWGFFEMALKNVGWIDLDARLLIKGLPIEMLLNSDARIVQSKYRELGDPYWRWVIPTQAYASGWLPIEEIHRLRSKLEETERMLERVDFTDWAGIDTTNPAVVKEYDKSLQGAFTDVLAMLSIAEEMGAGLFMVIS